ncbi:hypothetical protein H8N01_01085 [Streptomyces sp. AC536]|uniref:hypothetical protein n=1 Tax=Streptomyces buecherae TaxID=2763006 RepID=UPI00164E80CA|nr:hypothetical protein [Streptomyces buecherae]MBC3981205.1 hypothetical protein [Streptomyces buecherae]QNJ41022.1 hypothetical protein H7H31_15275 [Streptomyces buecherae]
MAWLMRAPEHCGAWVWELKKYAPPGVENALVVAERVMRVLGKWRLHTPHALSFDWYAEAGGGTGFSSQLALKLPVAAQSVAERIEGARPVGISGGEVGDITIHGYGEWIDEEGTAHPESNLIELITSPDPTGLSIEIAVFHDVWMTHDYFGRPHPVLHQRNAPRLAAALEEIDGLFGVAAMPGEPTYFGVAEGYEIAKPDLDGDGFGPNLTDKM